MKVSLFVVGMTMIHSMALIFALSHVYLPLERRLGKLVSGLLWLFLLLLIFVFASVDIIAYSCFIEGEYGR